MILSALLGATGLPQLKSAVMGQATYGTVSAGSFAITPPADAVGKPALVLVASGARTNTTTGPIRMSSMTLGGYGAMSQLAGTGSTTVTSHSPTYIWGLYLPDGISGSTTASWDYYSTQYSVSTAMMAWIIWGRPMTLAADGDRPAGGVTVQLAISTVADPGAQGYDSDDWYVATSGLFTRMGRWHGPDSGTHPIGSGAVTISPT